jgi:hypothetical protein
MTRRIRYHPLFDCDVRDAEGWYEQRSEGLGREFVEKVRERVNQVIAEPERFGTLSPGCRYVRLAKFPYVLLFQLLHDDLVFLGVLHTARSPEKWRERQQDRPRGSLNPGN